MSSRVDRITEALAEAKRDVESAMTEAVRARSQSSYYEALSHVENALAALHDARHDLAPLAGTDEAF